MSHGMNHADPALPPLAAWAEGECDVETTSPGHWGVEGNRACGRRPPGGRWPRTHRVWRAARRRISPASSARRIWRAARRRRRPWTRSSPRAQSTRWSTTSAWGFGRIGSVDLDDLAHAYDMNVRTAVKVVQAVLPGMVEAGWGRIVNVSSLTTLGVAERTLCRGEGRAGDLHPDLGPRAGAVGHHRQRGGPRVRRETEM